MATCLYSEMRDDLKPFADYFEDNGFKYDIYNKGIQLNVYDLDGIKQSYYPTRGTVVFHRSNDWQDNKTRTIHDVSKELFADYLRNPDKIQKLF